MAHLDPAFQAQCADLVGALAALNRDDLETAMANTAQALHTSHDQDDQAAATTLHRFLAVLLDAHETVVAIHLAATQ